MNDFILAAIIAIVLTVSGYVYAIKKGGIKSKNLKDWWFVAALVAIMGIFAAVNTFAEDDIKWLQYTEAYLGLDYEYKDANPMCETGGTDDRLTSHGGIVQNIFVLDNMELNALYTHHSCAINDDKIVYDAVGLRITYRIDWAKIFNNGENYEKP